MATDQLYNRLAMNSHNITIYHGWRDEESNHVLANHRTLRHVIYHSPSGFEWGYGGSGPADLALSILAHYFKEKYLTTAYFKKFHSRPSQAWEYHQRFKWDFVATWNDNWTISTDEITTWLKKQSQPTLTVMVA